MVLWQSKDELTICIGVCTHTVVATLHADTRQWLIIFIYHLTCDRLIHLLCFGVCYFFIFLRKFRFFIIGSCFLMRSSLGNNDKLIAHHFIRKRAIGYHSLHCVLRIDSRKMSTHGVALDILIGEFHSHTTLLANLLQGSWKRGVLERNTKLLAQTLCGSTQHKTDEHEKCHPFSFLFSLFHTH